MDRLLRLKRRALATVRRRVARSDWLNTHLPWTLWRALGAADSLTVAWVVAKRARRPLNFVQIGSNDGVIHDPLHQVVRTYGWSGVLVEPLPTLYQRLVDNYAGVPGLTFENAAIGIVDGTSMIYTVEPRPGDPYWIDQVASFDRATIESHDRIPGVGERIVEVPVSSLTLPTLMSRHGLTSVDLLHVDVEGYDYEVLKQIDFSSTWVPAIIIYEREHFNRQTDQAAKRLLREAGYRCVDIWPDQLAYRAAPETLTGSTPRRDRRPGRAPAQEVQAERP